MNSKRFFTFLYNFFFFDFFLKIQHFYKFVFGGKLSRLYGNQYSSFFIYLGGALRCGYFFSNGFFFSMQKHAQVFQYCFKQPYNMLWTNGHFLQKHNALVSWEFLIIFKSWRFLYCARIPSYIDDLLILAIYLFSNAKMAKTFKINK